LKFDVEGVAVFVISESTIDHFLKNSLKTEVPGNFGCKGPIFKNYPSGAEPWIALIQRGKCPFNEKIENAMKLNVSGVLIYDPESKESLQSMLVVLFDLPSVFTFGWKANLMQPRDKLFGNLTKGSDCRSLEFIEGSKPKSIKGLPLLTTNFSYNVDKISPLNGTFVKDQEGIMYCGTLTAWSEFDEIIWDRNITRYFHNGTQSYPENTSELIVFGLLLYGSPVLIALVIYLMYRCSEKRMNAQVILFLPYKHC